MIHKEGRNFLICILVIFVIANYLFFSIFVLIPSFLVYCFFLSFFRVPNRKVVECNNLLYAPADGKIVAIEETFEEEYLKKKCLQISIFMSIWNIHINWIPISGTIKFFKYHDGKYLVARHPKSSADNERTTVVIETKSNTEILLRQIAGFVARRVKSYIAENEVVKQGNQLGFIKFGSRVDILIPIGTKINIALNQKVRGNKTIIAEL